MAQLAKDPKGSELEDLVAAHFVSRGCYVETGIKERNPDEILELDIVWTDYRQDPPVPHAVEVKSGEWGMGDIFKFYGWTQYIGMQRGEFVHKAPCGRVDAACLERLSQRTGVRLLHVARPEDAETHLKALGLPDPAWDELPHIWQFSFWAQRRLLKSLQEAVRQNVGAESAKAAKEYHRLINDAVFFIPDVRNRVGDLLDAHLSQQKLAATAAFEIETGKVDFAAPPETTTFKRALFYGDRFPVQACLYLAHRARLYVLKAVVDYWLARERGDIEQTGLRFKGEVIVDLTHGRLSAAMIKGIEHLSRAKSFRLFPVFWQTFLWGWGGFLLKEREDEERAELARETGVPSDEVPLALEAFDRLFPTTGGWFREPRGDSRRVITLMPAGMRGIGAVRRRTRRKVTSYKDLGYRDETGNRMASDHNVAARLLDCPNEELVK